MSKKKGPVLGLLTGPQIETLVESISRARMTREAKRPSPKEYEALMNWASTTIADHTLLKAVLMGSLDVDIDKDGDVSFVPLQQLQGFIGFDEGKLH
jgi:isochorismate synthase EntC